MILEKGIHIGKKQKVIVGYDLGDETSQISFCYFDAGEPETLSLVTGAEQYNFPTVLGKRFEVNQWNWGKEALRLCEDKKGVLVKHLLSLAKEGEEIEVDGKSFHPTALLALFLKRSLSLLGMTALPEQIDALMITVENLDQRTAEVLTEAVSAMQIKIGHICLQSHVESFYDYVVHQPEELWQGGVLLCDYAADYMKTCILGYNRHAKPMVAFAEEREYSGIQKNDEAFTQVLDENCRDRIISSVYLIGTGFDENWYGDSLRYLCRGRRVFTGNNLYSKGACFGMRERLMPSAKAAYIFLGRDKLKANIGMEVLRKGQASYFALLDAGTNWFDARKQLEFILDEGNSFTLQVTSLTGGERKEMEIILDGLPRRGSHACRIGMGISMKSEEEAEVVLEDLGFGEIYPATHRLWREEFPV